MLEDDVIVATNPNRGATQGAKGRGVATNKMTANGMRGASPRQDERSKPEAE